MGPQARMAAGNAPLPEAEASAGAESDAGPFVINLCSSTTPMALSHPDAPELKRFSFFVSRRREDNRERFRLHMGYFTSLAEAEEWLSAIRDLYPGAWAGEAPGKKLRARAAAAELANQLPPPPTATQSGAPRVAGNALTTGGVAQSFDPVAARPATPSAADLIVPTLQAAPGGPPAPIAKAAPAAAAVSASAAAPSSPKSTASTIMTPVLASVPAPTAAAAPTPQRPAAKAAVPAAALGSRSAPVQANTPAANVAPSQPTAKKPAAPNALTGSNVREVMASLDETGETRLMRVPPGVRGSASAPVPPAAAARSSAAPSASPPRASTISAPAGARPTSPAAGAAPGAASSRPVTPADQARIQPLISRAQPPAVGAPPQSSLSDTQVLKILEQRRPDEAERSGDDASTGISLLRPDDTQTRRALKEAVQDNAPVSFAVQLDWSVQPVELSKVPPLAIFSAYTLYTVEGSREGRKWYGLRLGFFSDAISAKQVAYYVRSEFTTVAVVPVSPQERARASEEENKAATGAFKKMQPVEPKIEEFKLFEDDRPRALPEPAQVAAAPSAQTPRAAAAKTPARGLPKKNKPLGRVRAKDQRSAKTLEETLEILGASDLEIDSGRGEVLNDTGVRHLRVEVQKNTPFGKLLDRLSERVRKN